MAPNDFSTLRIAKMASLSRIPCRLPKKPASRDGVKGGLAAPAVHCEAERLAFISAGRSLR